MELKFIPIPSCLSVTDKLIRSQQSTVINNEKSHVNKKSYLNLTLGLGSVLDNKVNQMS